MNPEKESHEEKDYSNGTPWPDIDLVGVVTEDTPADVKENFALYVNKDEILSLKIPDGYVSTGSISGDDLIQKQHSFQS